MFLYWYCQRHVHLMTIWTTLWPTILLLLSKSLNPKQTRYRVILAFEQADFACGGLILGFCLKYSRIKKMLITGHKWSKEIIKLLFWPNFKFQSLIHMAKYFSKILPFLVIPSNSETYFWLAPLQEKNSIMSCRFYWPL